MGQLQLLYGLYREAVDELRRGNIKAQNPSELAGAIDGYVSEKLMNSTVPGDGTNCREIVIGQLYQEAVAELGRGNLTSRLEGRFVADSIDRWVNETYLERTGVRRSTRLGKVFTG